MNSGNIGNSDFSRKKAFEISYALFRISSCLKNKSFAEQLEKQAVDLLDAAVCGDRRKSETVLSSIEYFMRLGSEAGFIRQDNAQLIINETRLLNSSLPDSEPAGISDINSIFSKKAAKYKKEKKAEIITNSSEINPEININNPEIGINNQEISPEIRKDSPETNSEIMEESPEIDLEERQKVIVDMIRETGNCRLGEIQKMFPGVSDRTIRYDLQKLIENGIIQKTGSFGPGVYYSVDTKELVTFK